jgi:internalin A
MSDLEILKIIVNNIPELPKWEEQPFSEVALREIHRSENKNSYAIENEKVVGLNLRLKKLTTLPKLPKKIAQLTNLGNLNLRSKKLTTLPKEIGQLTNLNWLNLSSNQLMTLPKEIVRLTNLNYLNLSSNQLTILPKEIGQLTNLNYLHLDSNQLMTLPKEIVRLTNLNCLNLSSNQLTILPKEIGQLTNLNYLHLQSNQLMTLPKEIGQLTNLHWLDLQSNQLTTLPKEIGQLTNLNWLDLQLNQLTTLPKKIGQLTNLIRLQLSENPFNIPKEVYKKESKEQIQYILNLQEQGKTPLNEGKIILLGEGAAGKTALVERLIDDAFSGETEMTEGIQIRPWQIDEVRLNVWDFGGQEIMRALHQFFMTPRTLYVLVVTHRSDKEDTLEEWLRLIDTFGGNSPVLIVISKCDQYELNIDTYRLKDEYDNIVGFFNTSAKTNSGIDNLRQAIEEQLTCEALKHIKDDVPRFWINVKNELIEAQQSQNYINLSEYYQLCFQNKIDDNEQQLSLLRLLHDLGIAFNFGDFKENPKNTNVLKPEWVTRGIYKIINSNEFFQANGQVEVQQLSKVLSDIYDNEGKLIAYGGKEKVIIGLMEQFELCFKLSENKYLVPDLLKATQPFLGNQFEDGLKLWYEYAFLPRSIMPQFTTKVHKLSQEQEYWLHGCIIRTKDQRNTALIQVNYTKNQVKIVVIGEVQTRRRFLNDIQRYFVVLNERLEPKPTMLIFHADYPSKPISYNLLIELEQAGITKHYFESIGILEVKGLLSSVGKVEQNHSGSGDNVGGNKNIYNHFYTEQKSSKKSVISNIQKEPLENPEELEKMLIEGEIKEVLKELKSKTTDKNKMVLIEIRLNEIANDKQGGLMDYNEFGIERMKIINDILEIIKTW